MSRSERQEIPQAWRCGAYRIELAAPSLWVVTRERSRRSSSEPKVELEATTGSLIAARGVVARLHRKHCAERSARLHLIVFALVVATGFLASIVAPSLTALAVIVTTLVSVRTLFRVVDAYTGRSWEHRSHTYQ